MREAVYIVEFGSISRGIGALDAMCKRADLALFHADPICIGKYLICAGGAVDAVMEAQAAAEIEGEQPRIASCVLTGTHPAILEYFRRKTPPRGGLPPAIGIFESRTAAKGFESLDAALKAAHVNLLRLWLGTQLGGKLCWVLGGSVSDVQSAIAAARGAITEREQAGSRVITAPSPTVAKLFIKGGAAHEPA